MAPKAVLADATAEAANASAPAAKGAGKATVEQTYQKLTQHQHILQRPDTYVGSIEHVTADMFVLDSETQRMQMRKVTYVPGLQDLDEIVVNAADNKQRDASMTELRVDIDRENNRLSVFNNGKGIPVVVHKEHNIYVPELIFGVRCPAAAPLPLPPPAGPLPSLCQRRATARARSGRPRGAVDPGARSTQAARWHADGRRAGVQAICSRRATTMTTRRR